MIALALPPALAAAGLAGLGALLARGAGLARLGAALPPLALLVGLVWLLGGIQASPRQLPERLPMLALLLLGPAFLAARWPGGRIAAAAGFGAALAAGWWMAGAPSWVPDALRVALLMAGFAAGSALAIAALGGAWQGIVLPCGLAAMLLGLAAPGPWAALALVTAGMALGAAAFGRSLPMAGRIALGPVLAALALGPWLALGRLPEALPWAALLPAAALGWLWRPRRRPWRPLLLQALLLGGVAAGLFLARG